jgi:hypothetical protein
VALSFIYDPTESDTPRAHFRCDSCKFTYVEAFMAPVDDGYRESPPGIYCRSCAKNGNDPSWIQKSVQATKDAQQQVKAARKLATAQAQQLTAHNKVGIKFGKPADYTKGRK